MSQFHFTSPEPYKLKPLGKVMQQAGLLSTAQIDVALRDQQQYPELRVGEICSLHGWIEQQTADFFADSWSKIILRPSKYPLGYYLRQAALLNERQISIILAEQKKLQVWQRFGELACDKKWLKRTTLHFFLKYLSYSAPSSPFLQRCSQPTFLLDYRDSANA